MVWLISSQSTSWCRWNRENSKETHKYPYSSHHLPLNQISIVLVYTVIIIFNCTFHQSVVIDGNGRELIIHTLDGNEFRKPKRIIFFKDEEISYNPYVFSQHPLIIIYVMVPHCKLVTWFLIYLESGCLMLPNSLALDSISFSIMWVAFILNLETH